MDRQSRKNLATEQQFWLYTEEFVSTDLQRIDVYPPVRWDKGRAKIGEINDASAALSKQYLARFRVKNEELRDIVVLLYFELQRSRKKVRYHVMTCLGILLSRIYRKSLFT